MTAILPFRRPRSQPPPIIDEPDDGFVVAMGRTASALNLVAPTVIKPAPGRLDRLIIIAGGVSGAFSLHDCASIDAAGAANAVIMIPAGVAAGTALYLDWPMQAGIVLSAIPEGGVLAVSYS